MQISFSFEMPNFKPAFSTCITPSPVMAVLISVISGGHKDEEDCQAMLLAWVKQFKNYCKQGTTMLGEWQRREIHQAWEWNYSLMVCMFHCLRFWWLLGKLKVTITACTVPSWGILLQNLSYWCRQEATTIGERIFYDT